MIKMQGKKTIFSLLFFEQRYLAQYSSNNNDILKYAKKILMEGTMSQIFDIGLSFNFISNNE